MNTLDACLIGGYLIIAVIFAVAQWFEPDRDGPCFDCCVALGVCWPAVVVFLLVIFAFVKIEDWRIARQLGGRT